MDATATLPAIQARRTSTKSAGVGSPRLLFFAIAAGLYLLLFLSMDLRIGVYDEGFVLTAAMREMAGQVPHRDFYFAYGPAQSYLLALLFTLFGPSVLAARLLDLLFKSLLIGSFFVIVRQLVRPWIAAAASALLFLLFSGLSMPGSTAVPVSLVTLWATWLLLPAFSGNLTTRDALGAGLLAGLATLFRYDVGLAVAADLIAILVCAALLRRSNPRQTARQAGVFSLGFFSLVAPAAVAYLAVAPLRDLQFDVIDFPFHFFRAGRHLPFPGLHLKTLDDLAIYLPFAAILLALATVGLRPRSGRTRSRREAALLAFSLLAIPLTLKGVVRVSPVQMILALVPALLLLAILLDLRAGLAPLLRLGLAVALAAACVSTLWMDLHRLKELRSEGSSALQALLHPRGRPDPDPLNAGLAFRPGDDHQHAIDFIRAHTAPQDTLYDGVTHHDRIFANDNLTYFATQRLPATKWSEFDPGLQNQAAIQREMIADLERHPPPYILLDAEFDRIREPNASAVSSGVFLLDRYLAAHYKLVETWGEISAWQRAAAVP